MIQFKRSICLLLVAGAMIGLLAQRGRAADSPVNLRKTVVVDVAEKTKNAVVYISTKRTVLTRVPVSPDPFFAGFTQLQLQRVGSLGSGFIIHKDGYLVNGAGYYLMGIPVDAKTGNLSGSVPQLLKFQNDFLPAQPTTQIQYRANLAAYPATTAHDTSVPGSELIDPKTFSADYPK